MALVDLGFKFYDDAALTTPSSGAWQIQAEQDLSDGAHIRRLYFGSTSPNKILLAKSNPGIDNIILTPTYVLAKWLPTNPYPMGYSVIPTTPNGYRYVVTTGGTSGSTQPVWGVTLGGSTNDGTVVWKLIAEDRPTTEVTLALTEAALATNTPGAALSIGNQVMSGTANAISVWVKEINTITVVSSSFGQAELGININVAEQRATA